MDGRGVATDGGVGLNLRWTFKDEVLHASDHDTAGSQAADDGGGDGGVGSGDSGGREQAVAGWDVCGLGRSGRRLCTHDHDGVAGGAGGVGG